MFSVAAFFVSFDSSPTVCWQCFLNNVLYFEDSIMVYLAHVFSSTGRPILKLNIVIEI